MRNLKFWRSTVFIYRYMKSQLKEENHLSNRENKSLTPLIEYGTMESGIQAIISSRHRQALQRKKYLRLALTMGIGETSTRVPRVNKIQILGAFLQIVQRCSRELYRLQERGLRFLVVASRLLQWRRPAAHRR